MNYPIDFVLIWVDGNDTEWQKEKERYSEAKSTKTDEIEWRYQDWDILQYCRFYAYFPLILLAFSIDFLYNMYI